MSHYKLVLKSCLLIIINCAFFLNAFTPIETFLVAQEIYHSEETDHTIQQLTHLNKPGAFYTADRPLFHYFPGLKEKLPWIALANLPTSIKRLKSLEVMGCGLCIYCKDDGQTGDLIGGNKLRKLEVIFADALYVGASRIATFGCIGSNLVTQVCKCAQQLNLACDVYLKPEPLDEQIINNLLLDCYYRATIHFYPTHELRKIGTLAILADDLLQRKELPYVIPTGASSVLGTIGYINAAFELKQQIQDGLLPEPDYIYISVGSVGTIAGLALGLKIAKIKATIIGVGVDHENYRQTFELLVRDCSVLLNSYDQSFPLVDPTTLSVIFRTDFVGQGYGYSTEEGKKAEQLFKNFENLELEQVYTAKCAAALLYDLANNYELQTKKILFWNTFGIKQKTDFALYHFLPEGLKNYCHENM